MQKYGYTKGDLQYGWNASSDGKEGYYLPHSCDEWHIGDEENARALIEDLEELIAKQAEAKK